MITVQELELLASLLQRAGVTPIEAIWANSVLERLRVFITEEEKQTTEE